MLERATFGTRILSCLGVAAVLAIVMTACDSGDPPASDTATDDAAAVVSTTPADGDAAADVSEAPAEMPDEVPPTVPPVLKNAADMARMLETVYPEQLRVDGVGGTVGLWVYVDETGEVGEAEVRESSGYVELDEAALRLVGSMEFTPAQDSEGNARAVWISQPIQFTTEE